MTSLSLTEVVADASGASAYAWLLIALPLLGAAILLLGGRRTDKFGPLLGTGMSWASFVVGLRSWSSSSASPPTTGPCS